MSLANPDRTEELLSYTDSLKTPEGIFHQLLYHLPYYALLLDNNRRILASNENFLNDNEILYTKELFGKGPGDIFQCENAVTAGCGNSPRCKFCGLYKTIAESQRLRKVVSDYCKITVSKDSYIQVYDFMARCSPITIANKDYYLLTLTDVSAKFRKDTLEKIFFHDVFNIVNGLQGMVQIMKEMNHEMEMNEYLGLLSRIIDNLTETIAIQRDLMNAEKRELYVNKKLVSVKYIINSVIDNSMFQGLLDKRQIHTIFDNPDLEFYTDPVLLIRVLINMVKNALEAPNIIPDITLGCSYSGRYIAFYVHNLAYIDDELAKCIFQPIDSRKGSNRGLGTYSIRLIGENYLKGKVSFNTHPESGTTFTIELPVETVPE